MGKTPRYPLDFLFLYHDKKENFKVFPQCFEKLYFRESKNQNRVGKKWG